MKCPSEYKKVQKKQWDRLFHLYRPPNSICEEMAKRYFKWFTAFEKSSKEVDKKGSTFAYRNGKIGQSPAFQNMIQSEGEMRRLWGQIEKHFIEQRDLNNLGDFAEL